MDSFSVVIPAYNEESGIAEIMQRVIAVREPLQEVGVDRFELIIVDDGSRDKTAQIASDIAADNDNILIIHHEVNRGYGAALKTGFNQASGELIGFLDADGTYPPEYFPELVKCAQNGSDIVIGSRMSGAESQMPVTRRIGNLFFAKLISTVGFEKITDSASGMRVFKRDTLNILAAPVMVILGTKIKPLGLTYCGLCGFVNCEEKQKNENVPCAFNTGDLGIALGSAVSIAMNNRVDNRIMYTVGLAVVELKLLGPDVKIAYGIPLSATSKNPFFDRK